MHHEFQLGADERVYAVLLRTVAGRSPIAFFRACREVYLYAFSTASSNATLPLSLDTAERKLGISPAIGRFVLTVGSTANQNGTALFEGVTVMFLAQAYGLDLTLGDQVRVMVMSIVAGIGTNAIAASATNNWAFSLDFNNSTFTNIQLLFNFGDAKGNNIDVTLPPLNPVTAVATCTAV